jgi:hypothetical protein
MFVIPAALTFLLKHDRELVQFYPYASNESDYIECWLVVMPYMHRNMEGIYNCNIKLIAKNIQDSLVIDLSNINKIICLDGFGYSFIDQDVIPIFNELFKNESKSVKIKTKQATILNNYQYSSFEFDVLGINDTGVFEVDTSPINSIYLDGSQTIPLPAALVSKLQNYHTAQLVILYKSNIAQNEGGAIMSLGTWPWRLSNEIKWLNASGFCISNNLEGYNAGSTLFEDNIKLTWVNEESDVRSRKVTGIANRYDKLTTYIQGTFDSFSDTYAYDADDNRASGSSFSPDFNDLSEMIPGNGWFYFGTFRKGNSTNLNFIGEISDFRIYVNTSNREINREESLAYMRGEEFPLASTDMEKVVHYKFNGNMKDSSSNGFDALSVSGNIVYGMSSWLGTLRNAYSFSETSGVTCVDSKGLNNFTASTDLSTMTESGLFGKALKFSGSEYLDASLTGIAGSSTRSVSLWIKISSLPTSDEAILFLNNYRINLVFVNNGTRFKIARDGATGDNARMAKTDTLVMNEWNHISISYMSVLGGSQDTQYNPTMWVNGVETEYDGFGTNANVGDDFIGVDVSNNYFNGSICNPAILDKHHFTTEEVGYIYNNGIGREIL